jgi:citrate synthase
MPPNHVESTIKEEALLDAHEAAEFLGVKLQTLYAYASRGLVTSVPGERGRARGYARADLERLRARHDARSGHGPVAAGALRWGEPVLDSALTSIQEDGPYYRGQGAVALAAGGASFEAVAELLWGGSLPAEGPRWSPLGVDRKLLGPLLPAASSPLDHLTLLVPFLALRDPERFAAPREADVARARQLLATMARSFVPATESAKKATPSGPTRLAPLLAAALGTKAPKEAAQAIDQALILLADHELNVSSFTARVAASAGADLYACVSAALAAISGPLHGGVCDRVEALLDGMGKPDRARALVAERVRRGESIPGFGHPLYPSGDPRARPLLALAEELGPKSPGVRSALALVKAMADTERGLPTVDIALVALVHALGGRPGTATGLFALGRSAGWVAHILEQREEGHLLRPRARYTGPAIARPPV